jgi:hypothetical protein
MEVNKSEWKPEWHLYSSLFITCALMFIVINCSVGTPQVIGASFSPVVGGLFFASKDWRNAPVIVHKWAMIISVFSVFVFFLCKKPSK